jgi:hypothetical protein
MNHIETMKQALEFIEANTYGGSDVDVLAMALRTAIEQAEKQEPVATGKQFLQVEQLLNDMLDTLPYNSPEYWIGRIKEVMPLYTTPPAAPVQEPVALTKTKERGCTDSRVCAYHQACMGKCHLPLANASTAANLRRTDAHAAQRQFVGLTDEEMRELEKQFEAERVRTSDEEYLVIYPAAYWQWQRAIEAKLREKKGGGV